LDSCKGQGGHCKGTKFTCSHAYTERINKANEGTVSLARKFMTMTLLAQWNLLAGPWIWSRVQVQPRLRGASRSRLPPQRLTHQEVLGHGLKDT
jgi:hypothetical protein